MCEAAGQTLVFGNKLSVQSCWPHFQGRGSNETASMQHTHSHMYAQTRRGMLQNTPYRNIPICSYSLKEAITAPFKAHSNRKLQIFNWGRREVLLSKNTDSYRILTKCYSMCVWVNKRKKQRLTEGLILFS